MSDDSWYDVAQICLNGHVINSSTKSYPNSNQKHCDKCGQPTITTCNKCNAPIRGYYNFPGVISFDNFVAPSFCHECGSPFSWAEERIKAAKELAEEMEMLNEDEQELLKKSLDDLIKEGPRTTIATTRFKKLVSKAGPEFASGFKEILIGIVSETAKKALWPNN